MENDDSQLIHQSITMDVHSFLKQTSTLIRFSLVLTLVASICPAQNAPPSILLRPADGTTNPIISKEKALLREWELMELPDTPPEKKALKVEMSRKVIEKNTTLAEATFHQILLALTIRDALAEVQLGLRSHLSPLELDLPMPIPSKIPPLEPGDDSKISPLVWNDADAPLYRERLERIQSCNDAMQGEVNALMLIETHLPSKITHDDISLLPRVPDAVKNEARDAEQFFQNGDLDQAKAIFESILKKFPNSLYILSNLAVVHLTQGNYPEAETLLRQCVAQAPFDSVSHSLLGITVFNNQKDDEALHILARAVVLDPDSPKSRNYLALIISKKGWHSAAENQLRKALDVSPDYAEAHYNLAVLYALSAKPSISLAAEHYRRARELGFQKNIQLENILRNAGVDLSTVDPKGKF